MQNFIEFFNRGQNIRCNANKKNICCKQFLKNEQMGCKLLKIIANGLYDVCHRFGGWLGPTKLTRTQSFVNLVNKPFVTQKKSQQTILAAVTVGC
jgi:hypothetical protein